MLAIYDTMQFIGADVATWCVGQASAAAAVLLAAGAAGKRSALEHARITLAQPATGGTRGSMSDLAIEAAELARVRSETVALLARHSGRSIDQVKADTDRDLVLVGATATDYGIVDTVPLTGIGSGSQHLDAARTALRPGA
jgi:ATP-dependent Clp protease protease subunit